MAGLGSNFDLLTKAFKKINRTQFDDSLEPAQFTTSTRGNYTIRFMGNHEYRVNITNNVTWNDLIVAMTHDFYEQAQRVDGSINEQIYKELEHRGYKLLEDTPVIFHKQEVKKEGTRQKKWVCGCGQIARAANLEATCNKCHTEFKLQGAK